jgi:hypothetical protein
MKVREMNKDISKLLSTRANEDGLKKGDRYIRRIRGPMNYGGPREVEVEKKHDDDEGGWS